MITTDKAIEILSYMGVEGNNPDEFDACNMGILAIQANTWIPVSERLPEKNIAVLTYVSTGPSQTYCLAYWNDIRDGWEEWIGYNLIEKDLGYKVLAWMPLPEPYRAESESVK